MTFSFTPCCVPQSYHALQKEVLRESRILCMDCSKPMQPQ